MTIRRFLATTGIAAGLAATTAMAASADLAKATLKDSSGKAVADVDISQTPAGVLFKVTIKGMQPGERAFHIHAVGKCEAPFESAGPHFNPGGHKHGILAGPGHAGDMPNLHIPQSGDLVVEILNDKVTLEKGKPNSLFDSDGSALIIHAKSDDYKTDPAGEAGGRVACGVIEESGAPAAGQPARK